MNRGYSRGGHAVESKVASAIRLELDPVAMIWADEKPEGVRSKKSSES
jgi:hypothetical protein